MRASRTYVKICGITRPQDAAAAVEAGADALGFLFAEGPRRVSGSSAIEILEGVDPAIPRVGVFSDQHIVTVENIALRIRADWVQLSGSEAPEYCAALPVPVVKAIGASSAEHVREAVAGYDGRASAFLLGAGAADAVEGAAVPLEWGALAPLPRGVRFMISGGLTPENVGEAVRALRPWAVDVTSGVESSPGVKDASLMRAFVAAVRAADEGPAGR